MGNSSVKPGDGSRLGYYPEMHMSNWLRRMLLGVCALAVLGLVVACSQNEHRKVQIREEQQAGEVVEEDPGQMIVE